MTESIIVEGIEFEERIDGCVLKLNLENGKTEEVYDRHLIVDILSIRELFDYSPLELEIDTRENANGKVTNTLLSWKRCIYGSDEI